MGLFAGVDIREYGFVSQSEDSQSEGMKLLSLLGLSYEVPADLVRVANAISKRVVDHPTRRERRATFQVLAILLQEPGIGARLRRGEGPSGRHRDGMTTMVAAYAPRISPAEFSDRVLEEVRSALLRVPEDIGAERSASATGKRRITSPSRPGSRRFFNSNTFEGQLIVGGILCTAGIIIGIIAALVGGIPAIPLAVVAAVVFLPGLWTVLFMGFWLVMIRWAKRKTRARG